MEWVVPRKCRVVWLAKHEVGIEFEEPFPTDEKPRKAERSSRFELAELFCACELQMITSAARAKGIGYNEPSRSSNS